MTRTYWLRYPRDFANEYTIGIATSTADGEQYQAEGFDRIERDAALRMMSRRHPNSDPLYASVTINGRSAYDRFQVARTIRCGGKVGNIELQD